MNIEALVALIDEHDLSQAFGSRELRTINIYHCNSNSLILINHQLNTFFDNKFNNLSSLSLSLQSKDNL